MYYKDLCQAGRGGSLCVHQSGAGMHRDATPLQRQTFSEIKGKSGRISRDLLLVLKGQAK